jgi:dolichol-phosphate mannosyltransferase
LNENSSDPAGQSHRPDLTAPELSVVVPVFNEMESITDLLQEISTVLANHPDYHAKYEIIVIDDASTDGTVDALRAYRAAQSDALRILQHHYNYGQSTAIYTGVHAARAPWIVTLDGDGQNDPTDIPKLLAARDQHATQSDIQMICGFRKQRRDSFMKRLSSKVANTVRSSLLRDATPDTGCGLKLFSRSAFLQLPYFDHMHRFLPALIQRGGGKTISVDVNHRPRTRGVSKYGFHNRLWVGLVDLCGVAWLQRRAKLRNFNELE